MYKNITLNEFIGELQKLAVEHGNDEISSIGSSSGQIAGMSSPFCFNFKGHDATEFVAAYQQDVKAAPSQGLGDKEQRPGETAQGFWERTKMQEETVRPVDANYVLGQLADIMREMPTPTDLYHDGIYGGLDTAFGLLEKAPTLDARLNQVAPVKVDAVPLQKAEGELRHVWARVGMTLDITPEEEKAIFEGDYFEGKAAVKRVVMDGRASLDGETYIPEECIEDFDCEYGTNYRNRDEECAWSLDGDRVAQSGFASPCKVGDVIFEICVDGQGMSHVNESEVLEVSTHRIWVDSNYYDYDDIGRSVFLSLEDAEAALVSPEYLAARVNAVMRYNISDDAKKGLLIAGFAAGQEYYERDTERFIKLTAKGPFDIWTFDVFDKVKELAYSTSETAGRLALDILGGYIVPAAMVQEKSVNELISDASDKSKAANLDAELKSDVDFEK